MDIRIGSNGDMAKDENGRPYAVSGREARKQLFYILLAAVRGGFLYDPLLGSDIVRSGTDLLRDAVYLEGLARRALWSVPSAEVTGAAFDDSGVWIYLSENGENYSIHIAEQEAA